MKILFTLTLFLFSSLSIFARGDITTDKFMINPGDIDPLAHSGGPVAGGIGALKTILENISDIFLFIVPLIAGVSIVIAGYFYIFSAGDSEKANKGKTIIKWNIVAIFVAFLSYGLVKLISLIFIP